MQVDVVASLPAGINAIGKLAANSGVDIGDVDVLSLPALPTGANTIGTVNIGSTNTVDTELPAATSITGDATVAPTAPSVYSFAIGFNGSGWARFRLDGDTAGLNVDGDTSHDSADFGKPVKVGGRADTTFQTAVADGDRVDALFDVYGVQRIREDQPNRWSYHENSSSALTDASVQAAPGAGLSIYVTDIVVSTGAATAMNVFFEEGASTVLGPYYLEAVAGRGLVIQFKTPKKITANTALTITTSAAIAHGIDIQGFIAP